jgi:acetylornithine deacetylase/succinyl-diaminopimelate desuccinylase-like protein
VDDALRTELAELIAIPSISADSAHAADVTRAAEWVRDHVRASGGEAELTELNGKQLMIGEIRASSGAADAPTVICYGHFDVQPPPPLELWDTEPFVLTERGEYLQARGIVDDKGQLFMLLRAARELAEAGELPVNLRFCCDGEEEIGGHTIVDFLEADERGADAAVIYDSGMIRRGIPAFNVATRGVLYFHVRVRTGDRDLHSGMYGGAGMNATHAIMQTLSGVLPQNGRLPEPLRAGIAAPTDEELAGWTELPAGAEELADQGARPADPKGADEFYLRTFAEPSVDVNGVEGGSPQLQKTVLPVQADANVSMRLAPGQSVEEIVPVFERLLRESAPEGADVEIEHWSAAPPGLVDPDSPAIKLGQEAFERALSVRPRLVRSGGTLPIVPALSDKGIATVITGFGLPDSNVHSPNERLLAEYLPLGIASARELFLAFARLPVRQA